MTKKEFDIDEVMKRIEKAVEDYPKAALFELVEGGHDSTFEQLVACIISIRTRDEATLPVSRALFEKARTPEAMKRLSVDEIDEIIHDSAFHANKARQIHELSDRVLDEFDGETPCDYDTLTSFSGVGQKCANLVLGIACGEKRISVDTHVHRVTNRWGYVDTSSPDQTTKSLEEKLPEDYWVEINRLLVPFGKNICTAQRPKCSGCPVLEYCQQVGVKQPR